MYIPMLHYIVYIIFAMLHLKCFVLFRQGHGGEHGQGRGGERGQERSGRNSIQFYVMGRASLQTRAMSGHISRAGRPGARKTVSY
jgi:hypothetical protein